MKRFIGWFVCLAMTVSICSGICVSVSAAGEPYVTHSLPKTIKVGASLRDLPDTVIHYHNLTPGRQVVLNEVDYGGLNEIAMGDHAGDGPRGVLVDEGGNADGRSIGSFLYRIYRPGTILYQPGYYYAETYEEIMNGELIPIGDPIRITVEAPVIKDNAPSTVKVGSSLTLKTELTNTALTNQKVSEYAEAIEHDKDPSYMISVSGEYHLLAYQPIVEVVEGKELVKQSNQDYSNTLYTSETLSFSGVGTVQLKITYRQINTCGMCLYGDNRYNVAETITIQVTDDTTPPASSTTASSGTTTSSENSTSSASSTSTSSTASAPASSGSLPSDTTSTGAPVTTIDEETGIQLEADPGVVPPDTVIQAEEVKDGGNFVIINNALEQTSDKWVAYDISLISNQAEIQPNGNVKITIPRPKGLNMNKMVLYHVADDGTLTQIPFTMDKTKDNLTFETDHFSLYAVVESETAVNNPNPAEDNHTGLWIIVSAVILVLLIGAGGAVWFFKFHKRVDKNRESD